MKKLIGSLLFFIILGVSSSAFAYSYAFDIQSGGISLSVGEECSFLSITTIDDLVVDLDFDPAPEDMIFQYTASVDMTLGITLGLFGTFDYDFTMTDLDLGTFSGLDFSGLLGDGLVPINHTVSERINTQFGMYSLTDALLNYNITFTPDSNNPGQGTPGRYSVNIDSFSLSEGNTSEMLSGIISALNQSTQSPIALVAPFTIPMTLSGTVDIQADPVPVPGSLWFLGVGILGLTGFKRRQI